MRTKIVCTLGPASDDEATIRSFAEAGMTVARLNFSHGNHEDHAHHIDIVRRLAKELDQPIAIMADLQGPKLRVGLFATKGIPLREKEVVTLVNAKTTDEPGVIPLPHPEVLRDVEPGDRMLLDDGLLELRAVETDGERVRAEVVIGGTLNSRKGLSLPHTRLQMPSVTDKDQADAAFALEQKVDYFALSFVRSADDVRNLRSWIQERGTSVPIIAKIEKPEALDCIEEIIDASEGLMVARGDLGIEAPAEEVPIAQKRIIAACNRAGKPVITATQMLDSMMRNPRPTRAEASDVANAILDGSDAIMLSGETAVGRYAVEAVRTMARIAEVTERSMPYKDWLRRAAETVSRDVTDAIAQVACEISSDLDAQAIIASTTSGSTARCIARHRPVTPIVAPTPSLAAYRQLALVWGVKPLLVEEFADTDRMMATVIGAVRSRDIVEDGDLVIITAGVPLGGAGMTNMLKVHRVGEEKGWR